MDTTIGERIAALRRKKNITQEALGGLLGVTKQQISLYENGKSDISTNTCSAIAKALDTTVSYLIEGDLQVTPVLNREDIVKEVKESVIDELASQVKALFRLEVEENWRKIEKYKAEKESLKNIEATPAGQ